MIGAPKIYLKRWPSDLRETTINRLFDSCGIGRLFVRAIITPKGPKIRAILRDDYDPFDYTDMLSVLRKAL